MLFLRRAHGFLTLLFLLSGCDQLFYFPDDKVRVTPDQLDLAYDRVYLDEPDGTRVAAWHIKPALKPGVTDRHAVVVHFHGNAENMTTHVLSVAWLADEGFDVVTFDYRGYGESSGVPDRQGLMRDAEAVLTWVARTPSLAGKAVIIFGQSLGGAVAVPAAVLAPPPRLKAVVVDSTFDSYRHIARGKLSDIWLTWSLQFPMSFLVSDELSPVDYVGRLTVPLLVISGLDDPVVPLRYGQALFEAAPPQARTMWEVPFPGHTAAFVDEASPFRARLVGYLAARLAGR